MELSGTSEFVVYIVMGFFSGFVVSAWGVMLRGIMGFFGFMLSDRKESV